MVYLTLTAAELPKATNYLLAAIPETLNITSLDGDYFEALGRSIFFGSKIGKIHTIHGYVEKNDACQGQMQIRSPGEMINDSKCPDTLL